MTDLARIEEKVDRLLALLERREREENRREEDGLDFVESLRGMTVDEMVAANRARNKKFGIGVKRKKGGRDARTRRTA